MYPSGVNYVAELKQQTQRRLGKILNPQASHPQEEKPSRCVCIQYYLTHMYGDEGPNECLASQITTHRINSWIIEGLPRSIVKAPSHTLRPTAIVMENSNRALADKMSATRSSSPILESSQGCLLLYWGSTQRQTDMRTNMQEGKDRKCTGS